MKLRNLFGLALALFCCLLLCRTADAQPDYAPAIWNPAYSGHWYTTGNSHSFCVIHDMEGYYLTTISYMQQSGTQVSIHYCVNSLVNGSDGTHSENNPNDHPAGEISQLVREQYWAWHVLCWNRYTFGTEHEGFVSSPVWYSEAMYQASAGLQRHLCDVWGIPKDRNHIIGHNEWQNPAWTSWMAANWPSIDTTCNTHTDPGQYWDWNHFMTLIVNTPSAPTNLVLTPLATDQIKLTWADTATNEAGFKIERATSGSGPWTQIITTPANVAVYTNSGLTASTVYFYRVRAYNLNGDSAYSDVRSATTGNTAPVLAAIGNKTVTETSPLTFTASATDAGLGASVSVTDFESYAAGTANVLFQYPGLSGTTGSFLDSTATNFSVVTASFPAGHASSRVLRASWTFTNGPANAWLRLTTSGATGVPNPVIDFRQWLRFDIYSDRTLRLGVGCRETTNAAGTPIGSNAGSSSAPIEWVGVTNVSSGKPLPTRTITQGSWQTVYVDLAHEPVTGFTGNGILATASGLGALEHLALVPTNSTGGACNVYLDNVSVVYSNVLTFALDPGAPAGAGIDPRTGVFTWTPTEAQGPGVYDVTIRVTDNGSPALSDFETFSIVVNESNRPPLLAAIPNKTVTEGNSLSFIAAATDPDIPINPLAFSLDPGAPLGATIDPGSGLFSWTPAEEQGPGTYSITIRVTDDNADAVNTNSLSVATNFTVTVNESNLPPTLSPIADQTIQAGALLTVTNSASDPDLPLNALTFSLDPGFPPGASIDPVTGTLTWPPASGQAGSGYPFTVRVTDDGSPPLFATRSFVATVSPNALVALIFLSSNNVVIQWNAITGKTYRVQYKPSAGDTNDWNSLGDDIIAAGSTASTSDSVGTQARCYRVVQVE